MTHEIVTVERVVAGGEGLAHLADGRTVFVPGGLPGDSVRLLALDAKKRWARAVRTELVHPSEDRVTPPCALAARCGGCDWMGWDPAAQRRGKALIVQEAMRRTGGIEVPLPLVESVGPSLGGRGRVRLALDAGLRTLGFRARGTHDIVDVASCPMATDAVNAALHTVRGIVEQHRDGAYGIREIGVRSAPEGAGVVLRLWLAGPLQSAPAPVTALLEALSAALPTFVDEPGAAGHEQPALLQRWPVTEGVTLQASPRAFTQVQDAGGHALLDAVLEAVQGCGAGPLRIVDGCSGIGNFLLPLRALGHEVHGVDTSPDAVRDCKEAASAAGLSGPEPLVADLSDALRAFVRAGQRFDVVLLDPPRSGAPEAMPWLLELAPARIVYVACDPVSLAREAGTLVRGGYAVTALRCLDLFVHTHHVETIAVLDRVAISDEGALLPT